METMLLPLKRYAQFSGRSSRKEYWLFSLFNLAVFVLLALLAGLTGQFSAPAGGGTPWLSGMFTVVILVVMGFLIIPNLAVMIRRLHDQDRSGWFMLLGLVPLVGGLLFLVFMCLPGTQGPNRFGYPWDDADAGRA